LRHVFTILAGVALAATVSAATALGYTVQNISAAGWTGGSSGPGQSTFYLPADLTGIGCGIENSTTCEPVGDFILNEPLGGATGGYSTILDSDGVTTSDWYVWGNTGPNGVGEIMFYSDPAVPVSLPSFNAGVVCTENPVTGCTNLNGNLILADDTILTVLYASDGVAPFSPFGANFDTGDAIQFGADFVGPASTPEPSTFILGLAIIGLALAARKRIVRN
jgi:hypothetical protein